MSKDTKPRRRRSPYSPIADALPALKDQEKYDQGFPPAGWYIATVDRCPETGQVTQYRWEIDRYLFGDPIPIYTERTAQMLRNRAYHRMIQLEKNRDHRS